MVQMNFHRLRVIVYDPLNIDREQEIVTFGIPFPKSVLFSTSNIRVVNSKGVVIPAQFKVLSRWPDGSIMWLLIDFLYTSGEEYSIEYGEVTYTLPEGIEVWEEDERIVVYNSALRAIIFKNGSISIYADLNHDNVEEMVIKQIFSIVVDEDEHEYLSTLGVEEVLVEENGPLRTTILIKGAHKSLDNESSLNFTMRITFYYSELFFKITYTQENNLPCLNDGSGQPNCLHFGTPNSLRFKDLSLKIVLADRVEIWFLPLDSDIDGNANNNVLVDSLNSNILVYQDSSGGEDWNRWPGVTFKGYKVFVDGHEKYAGRRFEGWMGLFSPSFKAVIGLRYFWENYPKAFEGLSNGTVFIRLMPKYFSQLFEHRAGEHKTHEIVIGIQPLVTSIRELSNRIRAKLTPLYVRVSSRWYMDSGVFDYLEPFNFECFKYYEKNNLATVLGNTSGYYGRSLFDIREKVDFYGWMHFGDVRIVDENGGTGQMNLQYDFGYGMLVQSLRLIDYNITLSYMWWQLAEQAIKHQVDIDILHVHSGDPKHPSSYWIRWCWGGMFPHTPHGEPGLENPHRGASPHLEFQWNRGLIYFYYLTGYRKALKAALEVSENTYWRVMNGPGEPGYSGTTSDEARAPANALDILINAYYLTGDKKYINAARKVIKESHFKSKWYRDGPNPEYSSHTVAPWQIALLMISLGRYLDMIKLVEGKIDYNALESLRGYADWTLKYCYHPKGDEASSYPHFIYRWRGDGTQIDWSPKSGANVWQLKIADAYMYAWIYTGNQTYYNVSVEQFTIGSKYPWFEGNSIGCFMTGKVHALLSTSGNVFMKPYLYKVYSLSTILDQFQAILKNQRDVTNLST